MAVRRQASFVYLDKAESISTVSIYTTSAALVAEDSTGTGVIADLASALNAMSLAHLVNRKTGVERPTASVSIPTDDAAYNGNKLTVVFQDTTTGDKYQMTIPAVDPASYNTATGTKNVILLVADGGTTQIEDLVTAFEAAARSKDGNAVSVIAIKKSSARQGG